MDDSENIDDIEIIYSDDEDDFIHPDQIDDEDFTEEVQEEDTTEVEDVSRLTFAKHTKSVFSSAVSGNQRFAITGGEDDVAYVWDTSSGEILFECTGHKDSVTEVAFNNNDTLIATGDMAGMIQVWSLEEKKLVWCHEGDDLEWLTWHQQANVLICGCQSGDIYVWQIPSGTNKVLSCYDNVPCTSGKLLPNGKQLLASYGNGNVRLWDIKLSKPIWTNSDSEAVNTLNLTPDGLLAITAPSAQVIKLSDGKTIGKVLIESETEIEASLFNTDLDILVTGSLSGQLCIWQLGKFTLRHQAKIDSSVTLLEWGSDNQIYVGTSEGSIYVCDVRSCSLIRALTGHRSDILSMCPFANGKRLLTTSDDGTAKIFEI